MTRQNGRTVQIASLALVLLLLGRSAVAQDRPTAPEPMFEVASVKLNVNREAAEAISLQPDGSARFTGFQVRTLITMAYRPEGIQRFDQLIGVPTWLSADRFDIVLKTAADASTPSGPSRVAAMLRSLLRDRFRLQVHAETRALPAYALVVARRDGRLGPELHESTVECPAPDTAVAAENPDRWCGIRANGGVIIGRGVPAGLIAGNLSGYPTVDRFVTDRTGLTSRYDFRVEYSPAFSPSADALATTGPSLFTALTEQLGLRLQPETKTVPVLVIDRIEKPTPD